MTLTSISSPSCWGLSSLLAVGKMRQSLSSLSCLIFFSSIGLMSKIYNSPKLGPEGERLREKAPTVEDTIVVWRGGLPGMVFNTDPSKQGVSWAPWRLPSLKTSISALLACGPLPFLSPWLLQWLI